jgi:hypothetical protein
MEDSLLQSNAPVEILVPILQDDLVSSSLSIGSDGKPVNKFLLCTLVCRMAREIKARAAHNGRHLPLLRIVRDVLRSYLEEAPGENRSSAAGHLLNEEALKSEIERRLGEYLRQSEELRVEAKRLDLESVMAAEAAKRNRGVIRRG